MMVLFLLLQLWSSQLVVEEFVITEVNDGDVHGEIISSSYDENQGEGIYYEKHINKEFEDLNVGDTIKIIWTKKDYVDENWENIFKVIRGD